MIKYFPWIIDFILGIIFAVRWIFDGFDPLMLIACVVIAFVVHLFGGQPASA